MGAQRGGEPGAIAIVLPVRRLRHHIGDKPLVAGPIGARHHHRLAHPFMFHQSRGLGDTPRPCICSNPVST